MSAQQFFQTIANLDEETLGAGVVTLQSLIDAYFLANPNVPRNQNITSAIIQVSAADVRLTLDGQDPTATLGNVLKADSTWLITEAGDVRRAKFLGNTAVLNISIGVSVN